MNIAVQAKPEGRRAGHQLQRAGGFSTRAIMGSGTNQARAWRRPRRPLAGGAVGQSRLRDMLRAAPPPRSCVREGPASPQFKCRGMSRVRLSWRRREKLSPAGYPKLFPPHAKFPWWTVTTSPPPGPPNPPFLPSFRRCGVYFLSHRTNARTLGCKFHDGQPQRISEALGSTKASEAKPDHRDPFLSARAGGGSSSGCRTPSAPLYSSCRVAQHAIALPRLDTTYRTLRICLLFSPKRSKPNQREGSCRYRRLVLLIDQGALFSEACILPLDFQKRLRNGPCRFAFCLYREVLGRKPGTVSRVWYLHLFLKQQKGRVYACYGDLWLLKNWPLSRLGPLHDPAGLTAVWGGTTATHFSSHLPSYGGHPNALKIIHVIPNHGIQLEPPFVKAAESGFKQLTRKETTMDRPTTPLSTASLSSFRSLEGSPVERRNSFGPRNSPVTPTRSIKRLSAKPFDEIIDENDALIIPKNTRRINPSTASAALRLSTASLGAVRRSDTPTSTVTASASFYSAVEDEGDVNGEQSGDRYGLEVQEIQQDRLGNSLARNDEDSISSSPNRVKSADDGAYHFSSHLSPPPRLSMFRQSAPPSPRNSPSDTPSLVMNRTLIPRLLATTSSTTSSNPAHKPPRIRCNAPTCHLQTLCPAHLYHANSHHRRARKDEIAKSLMSYQQSSNESDGTQTPRANSSPLHSPVSRSPERHPSDEDLHGDTFLASLAINPYTTSVDMRSNVNSPTLLVHMNDHSALRSSHSGISSTDGRYVPSLAPSPTVPSTAQSGSVGGADDGTGYPLSLVENDPMIPGNTVIDWKTNASRRREYEEADRRRRGLWGWVRRRIRSLCCVKDHSEFWEAGPDGQVKGGDEGSVRRYRLVLPEEKEELADREEVSFATTGSVSGRGPREEPCSAPPTACGVRNTFSGRLQNCKPEGLLVRRASVAGDAGWRSPTFIPGGMTFSGSKDMPTVNVLEKVDSYGSSDIHGNSGIQSHNLSTDRYGSALKSHSPLPSPARKGKVKGSSDDSILFWKRKKADRWSASAAVHV
ncbi:hypothetical protein BDZ91DRAFT_781047 [Kalaharituber pfeilii]|nr:hypothetical protein BDZ91DRAFT_781047 [Kalaharituber pfeilii]